MLTDHNLWVEHCADHGRHVAHPVFVPLRAAHVTKRFVLWLDREQRVVPLPERQSHVPRGKCQHTRDTALEIIAPARVKCAWVVARRVFCTVHLRQVVLALERECRQDEWGVKLTTSVSVQCLDPHRCKIERLPKTTMYSGGGATSQ